MKKLLCALLALFIYSPAHAATFIHYQAAGKGTLSTQNIGNGITLSSAPIDVFVDFWIDPTVGMCGGPAQCSRGGSRINLTTAAHGFAPFAWLDYDHSVTPWPATDIGFTGGHFRGSYLTGATVTIFDADLTSLKVELVEGNPQNVAGGVWTWAAVPEPTTWALMLAGFGLAGTALRRRRAQIALA